MLTKDAYKECKERKICMKVLFWPGTSAGVDIWETRHIDACRFASLKKEECILHQRKLSPPISKKEIEKWHWGGSGCERGESSCTVLIKTWENKGENNADKRTCDVK